MLEIRLLGELAIAREGVPLALPKSRKTLALLAYLAATGRRHRRDRLCSRLWELPDDPRDALRWSQKCVSDCFPFFRETRPSFVQSSAR